MQQPFTPPDLAKFKWGIHCLKGYFDPRFIGLEQLDLSRPALFVGNHTIYGLLDIPLMISEIRQLHGVHLRSLGDHAHFYFPFWPKLLAAGGMVKGTPENCAALMQQGESILVFPGGSREVMRRKGDDYQLFWKNRTGFAKLAIEYGYDIIPFACVGPNECFDIHVDADSLSKSKLIGKLLNFSPLRRRLRQGDVIPPIATGLLHLPIPKPQKFYYGFAERISTQGLNSTDMDKLALRRQVEDLVQKQIVMLKKHREKDYAEDWSWLRKKLNAALKPEL